MFPLQTFAPDLNILTPGILLDCDGWAPAPTGGMRTVPGPKTMADPLPSECLGAVSFKDLAINIRTVAGTATKLYELGSQKSWNDVSKAGGYSVGGWQFVPWGNWLIAVAYDSAVQVQKGRGQTFVDLGGNPPRARYAIGLNNFIVTADVYGDNPYPYRVQWCAQGNAEDWTPSSSTQAGYQDLVDTPGGITGLAKLAEYLIVFKRSSIYLGQYVGPPIIWSFRRLGGFLGTQAHRSIVETEAGLYYFGDDDFYLFDGNVPSRLGEGVRDWFLNRLDRTYVNNMVAGYDAVRGQIFWWFPTKEDGSSKCADCLIFDVKTGRWGRKKTYAEAALIHWAPSVTYGSITDYYATYGDLQASGLAYGDGFFSESSFGLAYFDENHTLTRFGGKAGQAVLLTGYQGNQMVWSEVYGARPWFSVRPDSCTINPVTKAVMGGASATGNPAELQANGKADFISSGRLHAMMFTTQGDAVLEGLDVEYLEVAKE